MAFHGLSAGTSFSSNPALPSLLVASRRWQLLVGGMPPLSERPAIMSAWYGGARVSQRSDSNSLDDLGAILLEPQPRPSWEHAEEEARAREPTAAGRAAVARPLLVGTAASLAGAAAGAAIAGPIGAAVGSKTGAAFAVVAGAGVGALGGQRVATSIASSKRELQLQEVTKRDTPPPGEQQSADAPAATGLQSLLPRTREAASSTLSSLRGHAGEWTQRVSRGYTAPGDGKAGT